LPLHLLRQFSTWSFVHHRQPGRFGQASSCWPGWHKVIGNILWAVPDWGRCFYWKCGCADDSGMCPLWCLQAASVGDGNCCFCWEPLVSDAVMQLACQAGHFVHLQCAKQRLRVSTDILAPQHLKQLFKSCKTVKGRQ
jgi:hypothetical protein